MLYDEPRQDVIDQIVAVLTNDELEIDERIRRVFAMDATFREQRYALDHVIALSHQEINSAQENLEEAGFSRWTPPVRSPLLNATYADLQRVVARAAAISFVIDRLAPTWAPWPNKPLIDVLKTMRHAQLEEIAKALNRVGLHDLDWVLAAADDGG